MACDESTARKIIDTMYETISITQALKVHKIHKQDFFNLVNSSAPLSDHYSRAQLAIGEIVVSELIEIADTEEDPQKARNRIDTRKWFAAKARPDKYGDRIDLNISQVVDIKDALTAAKLRTRNVSELENAQLIDTSQQKQLVDTGPRPVVSLSDLDPSIKTSEDVFD